MTTRKLGARLALAAVLSAAFGGGGCATPGPLHVYSIAHANAPEIRDEGPAPAPSVPSFLARGEAITGFAYDPFTDHFFLRLAPGNLVRVVDRPAGAIKREFTAQQTPADGGGDLAVRPRDGRLFLVLAHEPALIELSRFGEFVRRITLDAPAAGVAFDAARDRLFTLDDSGRHLATRDLEGRVLGKIELDRAVAPNALGYDAERHEIHAPLAGEAVIGVFGENGHLQRTLPIAAEFIDVGPRSFLRMF
jgi:hypothetical protein